MNRVSLHNANCLCSPRYQGTKRQALLKAFGSEILINVLLFFLYIIHLKKILHPHQRTVARKKKSISVESGNHEVREKCQLYE